MSDIKSLSTLNSDLATSGLLESKVKQLNDLSKTAGISDKERTEKAATDFEALLLKQMFDEMWKTVPQGSLLGASSEEKQFRDMYTDALAQDIAQKQSIGVKQVLLRDFERASKSSNRNDE